MDIGHNEQEHKFFVKVGDEECVLAYKELGEKIWSFESTTVPSALSKKGIVDRMIEYAINFVKEHNIKILAGCEDVQDFLIKHKDLKSLVYHPY